MHNDNGAGKEGRWVTCAYRAAANRRKDLQRLEKSEQGEKVAQEDPDGLLHLQVCHLTAKYQAEGIANGRGQSS